MRAKNSKDDVNSAVMTTPTFVLELPVKLGQGELAEVRKRFNYARNLYNATVGTALGQLQQMRQDPQWRQACSMPKGKERTTTFRRLDEKYRLREYDLHAIIAKHREASGRKHDLGINEAQKLATRVYEVVTKYKLGLGGKPRFKTQSRGLHSISGKTNKTGLRFKPEKSRLYWNSLEMFVEIDRKDRYIFEALHVDKDPSRFKRIKYCSLVRKVINGKERYYLQLSLEGQAPIKHIYAPQTERLAIDPAPKAITVFHKEKVFKASIEVSVHAEKQKKLQKQMSRSLQLNNPDAFDENGTLKKGARLQVKSKSYLKKQTKLCEVHRRAAAARKNLHGQVSNLLLSLAGEIVLEKNSWKALQRGHFGKSLGKSGMGAFERTLISKAERAGCKVHLVAPYILKPSQYDPFKDAFEKIPLKQRWRRMDDKELIQRDMLSAVVLYCADLANERHNRTEIFQTLEGAKQLLSDGGFVVKENPTSNPALDPRFAPERKAQAIEEVRREILCGCKGQLNANR